MSEGLTDNDFADYDSHLKGNLQVLIPYKNETYEAFLISDDNIDSYLNEAYKDAPTQRDKVKNHLYTFGLGYKLEENYLICYKQSSIKKIIKSNITPVEIVYFNQECFTNGKWMNTFNEECYTLFGLIPKYNIIKEDPTKQYYKEGIDSTRVRTEYGQLLSREGMVTVVSKTYRPDITFNTDMFGHIPYKGATLKDLKEVPERWCQSRGFQGAAIALAMGKPFLLNAGLIHGNDMHFMCKGISEQIKNKESSSIFYKQYSTDSKELYKEFQKENPEPVYNPLLQPPEDGESEPGQLGLNHLFDGVKKCNCGGRSQKQKRFKRFKRKKTYRKTPKKSKKNRRY